MKHQCELRLMAMMLVLSTCSAGKAMAQMSSRPPFVEDEIAGIYIGQDRSDEIVRRYGPGIKVPGVGTSRVERLCYWDENRSIGLEFRTTVVDDIVAIVNVTTMPDHFPHYCRLQAITIDKPSTGKMIAPGDPLQRVLSVYGKPLHMKEEQIRGKKATLLEYETQHERKPGVKRWYLASIIVLDGKLAALSIVESEESMSKVMRGR